MYAIKRLGPILALASSALALAACAPALTAQERISNPSTPADLATYPDLVELAEASELVVRARIRRQAEVAPERAPGLAPGHARLYVEAETLALIAGESAVGGSLVYLVDVPRDAKGKPPKLKKREVLLFADYVPGRSGSDRGTEIQLAGLHGQLDYSPQLEMRLRPILTALADPAKPPKIQGVADALAVPGTLAGESETQIFLATENGSPVSITVLRRPGQAPQWGVSWGEIIDSAARPPQPETLRWYRLACSLPPSLPSNANLARDADSRRIAANDYALVVDRLGPCKRTLTD
jgi:hypothetical protein